MTPAEQFIAGCITSTALFWTVWLIRRARAQAAEARDLIRSARAGTDLNPVHPERSQRLITTPHWSDLCAHCHHERSKHHLGFGICLHLRGPADVCDCTAFEWSR